MSDNKEGNREYLDKKSSLNGIVEIDLFGTEFRFCSNNQVVNPEQIVEELRRYIENAEEQIPKNFSGKNKMAILLLAAMNITSDLCELKKDYSRLEAGISNRITSLLEKMNKELS